MTSKNGAALEQKHIDVLREHLPYELNMLDEALLAWTSFQKPRTMAQWFAQMSAIEMFWVKTRTLHEFFTRNAQAEGRTACANDFTAQPIQYDFGELGNRVDEINTQISHLNYYRPVGDATEKLDYYFALRAKGAIDRAVARFQDNLRPEVAKHWKSRGPITIKVPDSTPGASAEFSSYTGPAPR
jgi:hypothetical protein